MLQMDVKGKHQVGLSSPQRVMQVYSPAGEKYYLGPETTLKPTLG